MMPFKAKIFQQKVDQWVRGEAREELLNACADYITLTTPAQMAHFLHDLMDVFDQKVDAGTRLEIMQACGRKCIGASMLKKARHIAQEAKDIDDLLARMNAAHMGGGRLKREGNVIHAGFDRCYCGSVSKTKEIFSPTYCQCSCGWYQQLFETLLGKPVQVDLLGSIIIGDPRCEFLVHI
jgi:hypothetical protein